MSILSKVITGTKIKPPRVLIYGPSGVGKTTWAAGAPAPILVPTEDGRGALDIPALPVAQTYVEIHNAITALYEEDHKYRTVIIDRLDHLEPLIWKATCELHNKSSIEEFGYGKGYVEALAMWRQFFAMLTALRDDKGMAVICTAHHEIKSFADPDSEPYDRYQIKLHKSASALALESVDAVFFATTRRAAIKNEKGDRARGVGDGERILLTEERPSHVAKNRWSLPYELPLQFSAFSAALKQSTTKPVNSGADKE